MSIEAAKRYYTLCNMYKSNGMINIIYLTYNEAKTQEYTLYLTLFLHDGDISNIEKMIQLENSEHFICWKDEPAYEEYLNKQLNKNY